MVSLLAVLLVAQDWDEISRSVVALRSRSGTGSGFLVDDKGHLLTNAHVAACPLPFEVEVRDGRGGLVRFKRALLLGVHPERDLALIKIDPSEHPVALKPLRFSGRPPSTEQKVHALGFPRGSVQLVRTSGKVVETERVAYRRPYIEMDAEIHPGNSGGPLCDDEGAVIGVVTLKDVREDLGLAIPAWEYLPRIFVPLRQRAPDPAAAVELVNEADRCMRIAREERNMRAAAFAVHLYERAISWDPGNAELLVKVGVFEGMRNQHETGAAYLFRALQINPWPEEGPDVYLALGAMLAGLRRRDDARAVAAEGFAKYPDRSVALFEVLAEVHLDAREWVEAARYSSMALRQGSRNPEQMNKILQESRRRMEPGDTARFLEEDARYETRLAELKREADAARREGRAALTEKFKAFLDSFQGVQREGGDLSQVGRRSSLAPDADLYTDDEVTRLFLDAQLRVAREHIASGRLADGRALLEDIVRTSPKSPYAKEARLLLELMRK